MRIIFTKQRINKNSNIVSRFKETIKTFEKFSNKTDKTIYRGVK